MKHEILRETGKEIDKIWKTVKIVYKNISLTVKDRIKEPKKS